MVKITYPRPCPTCGVKINNRSNYSRHRKHCGKTVEPVPCQHCDATFTRKSDMQRHMKKFHSETAKRKASDNAELDRLEILHSNKVPRLVVDEDQTGGASTTRGTKRIADDDDNPQGKVRRSLVDYSDSSEDDEDDEETGKVPLFKANIVKMGAPKKWKKDKVIDQKLTFTLDQLREPESEEDLGVAAVQAITEGMDEVIQDMKIDPAKYNLALQIGSTEHRKESGATGETWHVPADNYVKRLSMTQTLLRHMASVLNSGEFISSDRGFSASMTLIRREVKGGKRTGYKPGTKIWSEVTKELKSVHVITNEDEMCCARAIVVMREYAKKKAGEANTFDTIRRDRGKTSQQLKEAKRLHHEAGVPEGPCGQEEIEKFQQFLGPRGYQIIVVDPARGGVIFTGEQFKSSPKVIQLAKTYHEDANGETKAHYDGVFSIAPVFNRCKFCRYCCKAYNTEDSKHHNCLRANCPSCMRKRQKSVGCPNYTGWSKLTITCRHCCRSFYGEDCYQDHLTPKLQRETKLEKEVRKRIESRKGVIIPPPNVMKSVCDLYQKCQTCHVSFMSKPGTTHRCGYGQCGNCLTYVNLYDHKCHIMSDIYKANKRVTNKKKAEDKLMKRIQDLPTEDGERVKNVRDLKDVFVEDYLGREEGEECEADCQDCEDNDDGEKECEECSDDEFCEECNEYEGGQGSQGPFSERSSPNSVDEELEEVKHRLQELGIDVAHVPEDKLVDHYEDHFKEHFELIEGKKPKHKELVFGDIECSIDDNRQFTPNLICYELESMDKPFGCEGKTCLRQFYVDLTKLIKDVAAANGLKTIQVELHVYFHNFRGFDGLFIIKQLLDMNLKVSKVLMTGQKILYFECGQLRFKDSLSFLNMPLEAFPKTFGIKEFKKGYFPHAFNKEENQDYEGPIPALEYYETHTMNTKKKQAVEKWHDEQVVEGKTWNFKSELLAYCQSDVKLLKQGCLMFAKDFESECGFNPLKENITIASACHNFWRNYQMIPYSVAVEPPHGWSGVTPAQSKIGFQWLYLQDQALGGENRIRHAANGGEQTIMIPRLGKVRVDGYDPQTHTVYEFHGCEFHGCIKCRPRNRQIKPWHHPDRTIDELYRGTLKKTEMLHQAGYRVVVEWECDFKRKLTKDPELQAIVNGLEWTGPLDPKDALFGGRTGLSKCHHKVVSGERVDYIDYTSLYPWVNKYGTYPLGHPTILKNPTDQDISLYFGVAKVDVLAPEHLFHPILPVKLANKCMFALCMACAREQLEQPWHQRTNLCNHTDQERMIRGTWCTEELKMAVQKGYQVLKLHEVWHWPENQRKTGLFRPYVNKFLKAKQEASGWPSDVTSEEQKTQYLTRYTEREGIQLDRERVESNPGRKQVAKVMLNR